MGDGERINFWKDQQCGNPFTNVLNIPSSISHLLSEMILDFIQDFQWKVPQVVSIAFPLIISLAQQVIIPLERKKDKLVWINSSKGDLTLKDAYLHKSPIGQNVHQAKVIWSPDVPPSKSMNVWRLLHNKLPTDDNLSIRGCSFPSMCSCCSRHSETSLHLFFKCTFEFRLKIVVLVCLYY